MNDLENMTAEEMQQAIFKIIYKSDIGYPNKSDIVDLVYKLSTKEYINGLTKGTEIWNKLR